MPLATSRRIFPVDIHSVKIVFFNILNEFGNKVGADGIIQENIRLAAFDSVSRCTVRIFHEFHASQGNPDIGTLLTHIAFDVFHPLFHLTDGFVGFGIHGMVKPARAVFLQHNDKVTVFVEHPIADKG